MTIDHLDTPHQRQIALWAVRILSSNHALPFLVRDHQYADADIMECLRLPMGRESLTPLAAQAFLEKMRQELEDHEAVALREDVAANLDRFSRALRLSAIDAAVVGFLVVERTSALLNDVRLVMKDVYAQRPHRILALALDLPTEEVEMALRRSSRLWASGLIQTDSSRGVSRQVIEFFSPEMAKALCDGPCDTKSIVATLGVVQPAPTTLSVSDFPHLEPQLSDVLAYLRAAIQSKRWGVNILLHGPPGTGKTQLTRVIAKMLELPIYDYATIDKEGEPKSAMERLSSMRVVAPFFAETQTLFVFDEFEDVLASSSSERSATARHKGWFNQLLENNRHPVFWLTNSLHDLDPAYARRFQMIVEIPIPPRSQRAKILRHHVGAHLSASAIECLSHCENLAPAVVAQAAEVMQAFSSHLPVERRDDVMIRLVSSILEAQGHEKIAVSDEDGMLPSVYDPAFLQTPHDLTKIAEMLQRHPRARICLHGPPGTGKTAFGHWLARQLDRPLHVRRASDLLSPYVGVAEKNLARVFDCAQREDAILLIDEVDSFLQDRRIATRSWEITLVNEFLTRMENHSGLFLATTNRIDQLDAASLRRFDWKLHFDFLKPEPIRALLHAWCFRLGIGAPDNECERMIASMHSVTPGDFAAVARRHRFAPLARASDFLQAIMDDVSWKPEQARCIGFSNAI